MKGARPPLPLLKRRAARPLARAAAIGAALQAAQFACPTAARAQEPAPATVVGDARDALPGLVNVPVAGAFERAPAVFAASGGYGTTESVVGDGDHHNRFFGTLAGSVRPTPWLAFALRLDGRYDSDSDASGSSTSLAGDPRAYVRLGTNLSGGFRLGAQLGAWVPGDKAPSLVFKATTVDLVGMAAYAPEGSPLVLALHAGGRWDNSASSVPSPDRLSASDRVDLGVNDASGVLTGLGASLHASRRVEILADVSADWLLGSRAPSAIESPIVIGLGARWDANDSGTVSLQAALEVSPSGRPSVAAGRPLVDIEPRVAGSIGLVLRPGAGPPAAPAPPAEIEPRQEDVVTTAATTAAVKGSITTATGAPIFHAQVVLTPPSGDMRTAQTESDGGFEFDDVPLGSATLDVQAKGYASVQRGITVDAKASADVTITLEQVIPPAQIRGLVRDFAGKPVAAAVVIQPGGTSAAVAADGSFSLDVKPGAYDVSITAKGYAPQKRHVVVEPQGVTLLNVDLRGAR
ncbi:MAG TPA: carboxypeptidase-like regulatory domain-containing protein [Polyangiaceae bacterium]|jgi:hypothetical protein|nr:carboxypeptidase-like regulatory domain-containing protein [Polyangiaceae bacterium]